MLFRQEARPSTSGASTYGTMGPASKDVKDHQHMGFTLFKVIETISSLYCSYFIYEFFINEDTLSIIYISWPVFTILGVVVILDRLLNFKREATILVFEIVTCFLGYLTHTICAISLMYLLNQEQDVHYDEQGTVKEPKFLRYIKPAVTSTVIACIYLMDCLLSADSLLTIWGIETWTWPDEPNLKVDLRPSTPLRMVLPWETSLIKESAFTKVRKLIQRSKKSESSEQTNHETEKKKPILNQTDGIN